MGLDDTDTFFLVHGRKLGPVEHGKTRCGGNKISDEAVEGLEIDGLVLGALPREILLPDDEVVDPVVSAEPTDLLRIR